jgi:hypothetical protein
VAWLTLIAMLLLPKSAMAWHEKEHHRIVELTMTILLDGMPAFFIAAADDIAQGSSEPDLLRDPTLPQLRDAEHPEHFLDWEVFDAERLPATRYEYYRLCYRRGIDPSRAGTLPYSVMEWTQRLTFAFAEHRRWPEDEHIRRRCLVYAGILAHYAADLHQPLHTTIHYDGRVGEDGRSPRSGIHYRMDRLIRRIDPADVPDLSQMAIEPADDLWVQFWEQFRASHRLVDRVYALEDRLPSDDQPRMTDQAVRDLATECLSNAVRFTAVLYVTAWHDSQHIDLPDWLKR